MPAVIVVNVVVDSVLIDLPQIEHCVRDRAALCVEDPPSKYQIAAAVTNAPEIGFERRVRCVERALLIAVRLRVISTSWRWRECHGLAWHLRELIDESMGPQGNPPNECADSEAAESDHAQCRLYDIASG